MPRIRESRVQVLSPDASPIRPSRAPQDQPSARPAPAGNTANQAGLPLDSLNADQLNLVVQRQNLALRRQQVAFGGPGVGEVALPIVLRVPIPASVPTPEGSVATGRPILPLSSHDDFIEEHIAPRLPEADYPPAPPLDKRRQPGRPGISYLFHQDAADTSAYNSQSVSLAPTNVVYGPGCSYLSLDVRTVQEDPEDASVGSTDDTTMRSVASSPAPSTGDLSYVDVTRFSVADGRETRFPKWFNAVKTPSTVTVHTSPPIALPPNWRETYLWCASSHRDVSEMSLMTSAALSEHGEAPVLRRADGASMVSLDHVDHAIADDESRDVGAFRPTMRRRVLRPALSEVSLSEAAPDAVSTGVSSHVAQLPSNPIHEDDMFF